jgi:hypothetical protein
MDNYPLSPHRTAVRFMRELKRAHIMIIGSSDYDQPEPMITPSPESATLPTFSYLLANF